MKKLYLLSTRLWIYLTEIPLIALLVVAITYNDEVEGIWQLYPLIITLIVGITVIFLYFIKIMVISKEEVVSTTVFSGTDRAELFEGSAIVIGKVSRFRISVEVFGHAEDKPIFDWQKDGGRIMTELNLFRGKAVGGTATLKQILKYFGADSEIAAELVAGSGSFSDDFVNIYSQNGEKYPKIRIEFKKTI